MASAYVSSVNGDARYHRRAPSALSVHASHSNIGGPSRAPRSARVLDVGCGDGRLAAAISVQRPDLVIEGVDVLVRAITHIPVRRFDGVTLPLEDSTFDVCLFVDVLHHTDDPAAMLREATRVSRGRIVIKDHSLDGFGARVTLSIMDWVGNAPHGVRLPYNYLTPAQWSRLLAGARLRLVRSDNRLQLYPRPFSWLFDRKLHFIAVVEEESSAPPEDGASGPAARSLRE